METINEDGCGPRVVVIGGGSGSSNILRGLKRYTSNIKAIITMFDSGGSSGLLRAEFGYPALGDLRQCLLALSDDAPETQDLKKALEFRFGAETSLNGHSVGNLLLAALTSLNDDLERAIGSISRVLRVVGQVVPVTLERSELCAQLEDGCVIRGESNIDLRGTSLPPIRRIFLEQEVKANPRAVQAVMEADAVVLGPGDLYTSILPNLLADGMADAISVCSATRIYVCNLMTKRGETDGFQASDFVREVSHYLGPGNLDRVLVNTGVPAPEVQRAYASEGAYPVSSDLDEVGNHVRGTIAAPLATSELLLRHDPDRTAQAIFRAMRAGRSTQDSRAERSSVSVGRAPEPEL